MQTGSTATARHSVVATPAYRCRRLICSLLICFSALFSVAATASAAEPTAHETPLAGSETSYPVTVTQPLPQPPATGASAADLSLFGILALGIIGLLWVRRHTSEL